MDDFALLKNYAQSSSEEAFRELVARHLGTVYAAARRQTGDSLAGDVTQAVFILLAKKAGSIRPNTVLAAWLLTTTRLVSRATLRSEFRRQRWEKEASTMSANPSQTEIQSAWEQMQPVLDDALAALPEKDRGLIALRFFQQKSHAEIAATMGLNEDASKKRLSRAIEKMRGFFSKRGVTFGSAILLAALSQHAVQAAPSELISHIAAAVTAGSASPSAAALAKTSLKLMTWIKVKIIGVSAAAVLVAASVPIAAELSGSGSVKTDGREAKIERLEYSTNAVRYTIPTQPKPVTVTCQPDIRGQGLLSAEFSWEVSASHPAPDFLRLVTTDDQGNVFDPEVHTFVEQPVNGRQYWVGEAPVFPRRGKYVYLRLMDNKKFVAEFKIPNPARSPHTDWTAEPLPALATNGDLEIALTGFRSIRPASETAAGYPRTECTFGFRQNGSETTNWTPINFELSDATGNHWMPSRVSGGNPYRAEVENGMLRTGLMGALWADESAWKIRAEFRRTSDFPENELLRLPKIFISDAREVLEPRKRYDCNGASVELAAVMGTNSRDSIARPVNNASREQGMRWAALMNAEFTRGCVTVVVEGDILSHNRRLAFVQATDEQGRAFELKGSGGPATVDQLRYPIPYSYVLRPPEGAHEINLVLAVTQPKTVEFLAKPEQVNE
ncbi:MAG TPA: sigma-70 family RNA polymerase sigma factor [Candidatus Angelobacter sp.]|nr:sigma-70 family RNA polymerase sigma factor [Candidatus Angelobacter sp.]